MSNDPIVDEVRKAREEIAALHGFDIRRIIEDAQRRQAEDGHKVITREEFRRLRADSGIPAT